jgi:hypothetical protein
VPGPWYVIWGMPLKYSLLPVVIAIAYIFNGDQLLYIYLFFILPKTDSSAAAIVLNNFKLSFVIFVQPSCTCTSFTYPLPTQE